MSGFLRPPRLLVPALLAGAAVPLTAQTPPPLPQGVTILESRDLQATLADARRFLAQRNFAAAISALQEVLDADPASLVRVRDDDLLFAGAVEQARALLDGLPPEAAAVRERNAGSRAAEALRQALNPPDLDRLREIPVRYAGTRAAHDAREALRLVLLDRGLPERAAAGRPLSELLPPKWLAALPAPLPSAPLLAPSYHSLDDPRLPTVRGSGLRERWRYLFQNPPPFGSDGFLNHRAAIGGGVVYLTDSKEVVALRMGDGSVLWRYPGPEGWKRWDPRTPNGRRMLSALSEGFDSSTLIAPVLEDGVLLAALQEPLLLGRSDEYRSIAVRHYLPGRRLYAFEAASGKILWKQQVPWLDEGQRQEPHDLVAAPPAAAAGRVFVPVYSAAGTLDLSLLALDLHDGHPLWRTFLVSGSRESNLFGNVLSELACAPPAADTSRVLVCTNLGAVCALNAATGAALWTRLYERTHVRTFQTGSLNEREEYLVNQPPAYDGEIFLCAPTDSRAMLALEAADGELVTVLDAQRAVRGQRPTLRNLVALLPDGAFLSGTHGAFLGFPGHGGIDRLSSPTTSRSSLRAQQRAGALARGEFLLPTSQGILRVDPRSFHPMGSLIPWSERFFGSGSLQAAPGMVLVLKQGGLIALASAEGLVESLPQHADPAQLAEVLPLLEGTPLGDDPGAALRVARSCERLATDAANREQKERLLLLAGRARLAAGQPDEAAQHFRTLLDSPSLDRRLQAAAGLADTLDDSRSDVPSIDRALAVLGEAPEGAMLEHAGRREAASVIRARLRYRYAAARSNREGMRRALLALLLDPAADRAREDGAPVPDWATARLEELLASSPEQRRAMEEDARRALATGEPSERILRTYAATDAVRDWLDAAAGRPDLSRAERVRIAALLRDTGATSAAARKLLDPRKLFATAPLPSLPPDLAPVAEFELGSLRLVAAHREGEPWLLLQDGADAVLASVNGGGVNEIARHGLDPSRSELDLPPKLAYFSASGATIVDRKRLVRLGFDGSTETIPLPGRADVAALPERCGDFLALLCSEGPDREVLQLRDLESGQLFYQHRLAISPSEAQRLLFGDDTLTLLRGSTPEALRFDPLRLGPPRALALPRAPDITDLEASVLRADGLELPATHQDPPAVAVVEERGSRRFPVPSQALLKPFAAPGGSGWLMRPLIPGRQEFPNPELAWLPDGADEPVLLAMTQPKILFPQVAAYGRLQEALSGTEFLAILRGPENQALIQAWRLGGSPQPLWSLPVEGVPFTRVIERRLPRPAPAADGWLLPLVVSRGSQRSAALECLLIQRDGVLRDRIRLPAPRRGGDLALWVVGNSALVRSGNTLHLLGRRP